MRMRPSAAAVVGEVFLGSMSICLRRAGDRSTLSIPATDRRVLRREARRDRPSGLGRRGFYPSVESITASDLRPATKFTLVRPSILRNFSAGTFLIGPGPAAWPGAG